MAHQKAIYTVFLSLSLGSREIRLNRYDTDGSYHLNGIQFNKIYRFCYPWTIVSYVKCQPYDPIIAQKAFQFQFWLHSIFSYPLTVSGDILFCCCSVISNINLSSISMYLSLNWFVTKWISFQMTIICAIEGKRKKKNFACKLLLPAKCVCVYVCGRKSLDGPRLIDFPESFSRLNWIERTLSEPTKRNYRRERLAQRPTQTNIWEHLHVMAETFYWMSNKCI